MSMCDYPNWHEIKDLVAIYGEDEWDDARVVTWDPKRQVEYDLVFCGSTRPSDGVPGEINFVLNQKKDSKEVSVFDVLMTSYDVISKRFGSDEAAAAMKSIKEKLEID